jgi:hypothetical protein
MASETTDATASVPTIPDSTIDKDLEIQALKESLAKAQAAVVAANAQAKSVPSTIGDTEMQGNTDQIDDVELKALLLDWGDFDPEMIRQMKQDPQLKKAFIAAHTLNPEVTQCLEGSKLSKRETKRPRMDGSQILLAEIDKAEITEETMKTLFQQ